MSTRIIFIFLMMACLQFAEARQSQSIPAQLKEQVPSLLQRDRIAGMSIAWVSKGKLNWSQQYGVANADKKNPVTDSSLFEAASLSKVATAYAALKLVDAGLLDLDKPLNTYLGNNYDMGHDPRANLVTARRVLTHTAGFPNWRNGSDTILPIYFTPGERFSYSGEGFVYLSRVMEKLTGMSYTDLMSKYVFVPLGMKHSSMVYQPALWQLYVWRHSWLGMPSILADYPFANAAASLRTTVKDYATFIAALLNGTGLKKQTQREMFRPQIMIDSTRPQLAWGLGIGLEVTPTATYGWHWGDQGDSKAFFMADIATRNAVIYFTNSANGLSIAPDLMALAFGKQQHDIARFVGYGKFDKQAAQLYETILQQGATVALQQYVAQRQQPIDEQTMNSLGYALMRDKKMAGAIQVFTQNTKDYPQSANVWDSLAEAYMESGDKVNAITYYEKSLKLDPRNTNAEEQLKKLRQ